MREHGGNLDQAMQRFGGHAEDWIDLSTGINRHPYPVGEIESHFWTDLPSRSDLESLHQAARRAYGTDAPILAMAGAQAAIQLLPRLAPQGRAHILAPTYNEYAGVLSVAGWDVAGVSTLDALAGADIAVVVNPNNPDGRSYGKKELLALLPHVGRLIIDESFADPMPELSLAAEAGRSGLLILRSFGKFYGLAGLRLGFVLGGEEDITALSGMIGPWPVSGAAIAIGRRALLDGEWARRTVDRLKRDCERLDATVKSQGWNLVGGTSLFRLYETEDARTAQARLAGAHIWSRIFEQQPRWLRLGLPGSETEWECVTAALSR